MEHTIDITVPNNHVINSTIDGITTASGMPATASLDLDPTAADSHDIARRAARRRQRAARRQRLAADAPGGVVRSALDADWHRVCADPAAISRARSWSVTRCHINDLDDLVVAAGYDESGRSSSFTGTESEQVLWRLVAVAHDDELAARVVMRRILPGLLAAIRRRPRGISSTRAIDDLMAGAWIAIRTFDPRRHPSCLAAALISDAVYRAFHAENRRQVPRETVSEFIGDQPSAVDEHDLHALRQVLIEAQTAGLDPLDVEVVRRVIVGGSTEAVAADLGVTARAVRYRCTRVVAELARFTEIGDLRPAG